MSRRGRDRAHAQGLVSSGVPGQSTALTQELGRHKSLVLTNMESGIGRGRGRGRGVSGSEVIERVDLRRPHVPPPQVSQAAPPVGIRQTSEGTAATPGKRRTQVLRKSGRR